MPLSSTSNFNQWYEEDPMCPLRPSSLNLKYSSCLHDHLSHSCTTRSDQMEEDQWPAFFIIPPNHCKMVHPTRSKPTKVQTMADMEQLKGACNWKLVENVNHSICFPFEIATANLRPDPLIWSYLQCRAHCSLGGAVEEAFKHKSFKFAKLAADAEQCRWKAKVCPVEDSGKDFLGNCQAT